MRSASGRAGRHRAGGPLLALLLVLVGAASVSGCVVVPRYARGTLADPAMQESEGMMSRTLRKLRGSREGAAGGDGAAAGGGCGCGQ